MNFYTTALKHQNFTLHYVDAFAGVGQHSIKIHEKQSEFIPSEDLQGSVNAALDLTTPFHRYHFNDMDEQNIQILEELRKQHPSHNISLYTQDANEFVPQFCSRMKTSDRAVLFLDPFSTELDWATLGSVAATENVDLWLLFPISVILRMTPTDRDRVKPEWKPTLDRLLGTSVWEQELYKEAKGTGDLFDENTTKVNERVNTDALNIWIKNRLEEEFKYVGDPFVLHNKGTPLFSFFFAVSNPHKPARRLADKVVTDLRKTMSKI